MDRLKDTIITTMVGAPVLWTVFYFYENMAPWTAGLLCWLGLCIASIAITVVVSRLNNTRLQHIHTPLPHDHPIASAVIAYTTDHGMRTDKVFILDRHHHHNNLHSDILLSGSTVYISDILLADQNHSEILSLVAHEVGHKKKHLEKQLLASMAHMGVTLFLLSTV